MKSPVIVGVDISQAWLDIALEHERSSARIDNTQAGIRHWLKQWSAPCLIGVESTGRYHEVLVREALAQGHTVYILNARDLSHYARALGRRAKTDRLDAHLIARYLAREHQHLHPYRPASAVQTELNVLVQRRHTVIRSQQMLRQSLSTLTSKPLALKRAQAALTALIAELDQRIQRLLAQDAALAHTTCHLDTLTGFGPLTSVAMSNAITRHSFEHADAFIAYIGFDPRVRDSGQLRGRRYLSKRGPAELRRLLYLAAMAARKTKLWKPFYERYRARGLSNTAALVVLARKLARIAFSMVKHDTPFRPELIQKHA